MQQKKYLKWEEVNSFWEETNYLWEDIAIFIEINNLAQWRLCRICKRKSLATT